MPNDALFQVGKFKIITDVEMAKVMKLVKDDKLELAEALNKVTEDALKEQQAEQEQPSSMEEMTPDMATAGATVNAMAGPQSPIPGLGSGMASLGDMLGQLRRPAMTVQPMRGVERGAV